MGLAKTAAIAVLLLALGYVIGNLFPLGAKQSVRGDAELRIILLDDGGTPVYDTEVDVAENSGQPPEGGSVQTDANGTAVFFVKPGRYVVYFNVGNFSQNLQYPQQPMPVVVQKDGVNEKTIILKRK